MRDKIKTTPVYDNEAPVKKDSAKTIPEKLPVKKQPVIVNKTPVKKKPIVVRKPAVKKNPVATNKSPFKKNPVASTKPPVNKPVVVNKPPVNTTTATPTKKPVIDTMQETTTPVVKVPIPPVRTPEVLINRTNELVKVLTVHNKDVTVKLYDNGEIDGDSISVYLDKKLVLGSKGLTATPLIINFRIDEDNSEHELVMVAENMGRIPPNTSLMIVECGDQRFDVHITSTDQKNAVVRFRYQAGK